MAAVAKVVGRLSADHVPFGVLQQDCLASAPPSARVAILPAGAPAGLRSAVQNLGHRGIAVLDAATPGWDKSAELPRVAVSPAGVNLRVRDVPGGRLYALESDHAQPGPVHIALKGGKQLSLGLETYALVRQRGGAVDWIEGAGEIRENGELIASVENGRAILASGHGEDLAHAETIRLLAEQPTTVRFARAIASASISLGAKRIPIPVAAGATKLTVDDQLARYVIEVNLSPTQKTAARSAESQ